MKRKSCPNSRCKYMEMPTTEADCKTGDLKKAVYNTYVRTCVGGYAVVSCFLRYRNHRVLVTSSLTQAALLVLMPELTRLHRYNFIVLRILQGAAAVSSSSSRFRVSGETC